MSVHSYWNKDYFFRAQLMVRCEGKDECRKIHVPYVDTHVQRTRDRGQVRVSH